MIVSLCYTTTSLIIPKGQRMNETKKYSHVCCRVQNPCVRQWIEWASPHFLISHQGLAQDKIELPVLTEFKDIHWSHHMPGQLLNKGRQTFLFSSQLNQEESQNLCKYITLKLSRTAEKKKWVNAFTLKTPFTSWHNMVCPTYQKWLLKLEKGSFGCGNTIL